MLILQYKFTHNVTEDCIYISYIDLLTLYKNMSLTTVETAAVKVT